MTKRSTKKATTKANPTPRFRRQSGTELELSDTEIAKRWVDEGGFGVALNGLTEGVDPKTGQRILRRI